MGLRDRKKAESRQRMLDAAKALFVENGYSKTNMEEIAERAGFGVATLYNYFKTKEGVFATMAREDMAVLKQRGEHSLAQHNPDPVSAVYDLLQIYNRVFEFISYGAVQEFQDQAKTSGPLHDVSAWVHGWQQNQVCRALRYCQSQGTVSEGLDCELAAEIVIDQLVRHSQRMRHISIHPPDISHLKSVLELMLAGWLCRKQLPQQ
jgi:AcrR family transcriptional regulator